MPIRTVLIDLCPAYGAAPGTARLVREQAKALFEIDVPWRWKVLLPEGAEPFTTPPPGSETTILSGKSQWKRSTFGIMAHTRDVDLVFATAYFVPWMGPPVVANFFDSNVYEHFDTWVRSGRLLNALLIRGLSNFAVHRARKLVVLSDYCGTFLKAKFPRHADKFVTVPPGISAPVSRKIDSIPSWAPATEKEFLVYVGVYSENKNQRRLIEAHSALCQSNPDAPALVLVGPCPEDYRKKHVEPALAGHVAPSKVILTGRIPDEELDWAYQNALAYIQPSIAEGFGLPVIEAMSHGLPVACSNTTSLPETAGGAALLFNPFDVCGITESLRRICSEALLREELVSRGGQRWPRFTWNANAERVANDLSKGLVRLDLRNKG